MTPLAVWLGACAWLGPADLAAFEDHDGDELAYSKDCNDEDPTVLSGYPVFADADGDGHGDPNVPSFACEVTPGLALSADDCDDSDPLAYRGATERCGGSDEDCDGFADDLDPEGVLDATRWYADADQDTFGAGEGVPSCSPFTGRVDNAADCDDADDSIHPGAPESCGGVDNDCDFRLNDDDDDVVVRPTWYKDSDGDGYGDSGAPIERCVAPALYVALGTDCDDQEASISPAATEQCGGGDEDCDGLVDDADPSTYGLATWYADVDQDGFGDLLAPSLACLPLGRSATSTDCDDTLANVNPTAQERCDTADLDEDCDGADDDDDDDATGKERYYVDGDGDDHGASDALEYWCDPPADVSVDGDDCNDLRADVFPGAAEVWYDGLDQDCDYASDLDADGDGFDSKAHGGDDCDDTRASTNPSAPDVWYDGVDADCDAASDFDADRDGFDSDAHGGDDCDDADEDTHPGATETWYDGVDSDCEGDDDYDADADKHRADAHGGDDCDDTEPTTYPDADEFVDTVDSNCDGKDYVCGDTIRRVPRDLPTPQAAILASCPGDTVRVDPGDWTGPFLVDLAITIDGTGPGVRFLGAGPGAGPVVRVSSAVTLSDLTISGGDATTFPGGGGIQLTGATGARLERLVISGNRSDWYGGGVTLKDSGFVRMTDVLFEDNVGQYGGGLLAMGSPDVRLSRVTFRHNDADVGGGLFVGFSDRCEISEATFEENTASSAGGANIDHASGSTLRDSTFTGNQAKSAGALSMSSMVDWRVADVDIVDNVASPGSVFDVQYSDDCLLEDLYVHGNDAPTAHALALFDAACELRDATISENTGVGLWLGYTPDGVLVEDTTIDSNGNGGATNAFNTVATYRRVSLRGNRRYALHGSSSATLEEVDVRDTIVTLNWAVHLTDPVVRGLAVRGSTASAVHFVGVTDVENLLIAGNQGTGLLIDAFGTSGRVDHATIIGNLVGVAQTPASRTVTLDHLISAHNLVGVQTDPTGLALTNCNLGSNGSGPTSGGFLAPQCSTVDPGLQTYGPGLDSDRIDAHLRADSPLVDAGPAGHDADGSKGDLGVYGGPGDWFDGAGWGVDADNDTLPDGWELDHGFDPTKDSRAGDADGDGLSNLVEYGLGTMPSEADSDDDGLDDKTEGTLGTNPTSPFSP